LRPSGPPPSCSPHDRAWRLACLCAQEVRRSEMAADILSAIPTGPGADGAQGLSQSERQVRAREPQAAHACKRRSVRVYAGMGVLVV